MSGWNFWIDRGGTFTDIVARRPDGALITRKLLSADPARYDDPVVEGIRRVLREAGSDGPIETVRIGTTVATNALLERRGAPVLLAVTGGFADALRIGYQSRPALFDLDIRRQAPLYAATIEIDERIEASGRIRNPLDESRARQGLAAQFARGFRAVAIVLMHGYRFPRHERRVAEIAREIGFTQVSASHAVSPLMKFVARGDTTVLDAYLSPLLADHVAFLERRLAGARLWFMQSNGGLVPAAEFRGRDAVLSGPAGGVVGAAAAAGSAGIERIIGFDMGGTSTDVCHYAGRYERAFESAIAGVRLRTPIMDIHTVAAGGGSICRFDGARLHAGPESAGSNPGPACYRRGGPLTVTDCNLALGRLQPDHFPRVFGPGGDRPLDPEAVIRQLESVAASVAATGRPMAPLELADGFLRIAVDNMANAIKRVSIERGHDPAACVLVAFGGAAGQHACLVAEALGIRDILIHPLAGVLSAYGIGMAEMTASREMAVEQPFDMCSMPEIDAICTRLAADSRAELRQRGIEDRDIRTDAILHVKFDGADTTLAIPHGPLDQVATAFESMHRARFGYVPIDSGKIVEMVTVDARAMHRGEDPTGVPLEPATDAPFACARVIMTSHGETSLVPVFERHALRPGHRVIGPALIAEANATTVVDVGWQAHVDTAGSLRLRHAPVGAPGRHDAQPPAASDPIRLELFHNLFAAIAERMGETLRAAASSVNIKERLDFSCAVFDGMGRLIANAPHIPVHLGSMGDSIAAILRDRTNDGRGIRPGDVYVLNAPYNGGTHLPDITAVMPVFAADAAGPSFFVAARGHHADIGGTTPGSMPPDSRRLAEEGVVIDDFLFLDEGRACEADFVECLSTAPFPARDPARNLADLRAQVAACRAGAAELARIVAEHGPATVMYFMGAIRANAADAVRRCLDRLPEGRAVVEMDDGARIAVAVAVDRAARRALIDFTGTSAQHPGNFNAPRAITRAVVLYVFRCLIGEDIPLNDGCLEPLDIRIPPGSMLAPSAEAAVVAGNVETSQCVADALLAAVGALAGSQGTMNNLTFGDARRQYYETICGGTGAGSEFDGADAVQSHMTNSRLTDPEVLEWRFPVLVEGFAIRRGSGGAGHHHGGEGAIRRLRFLEPMTAAILANRRRVPPQGLGGGAPGLPGRNTLIGPDGSTGVLPGTCVVAVAAGDILVIETPGGGGYGCADPPPCESAGGP